MTKYSWLIVYLTAASPIMDDSFFDDIAIGKDVITPFSSARCSEIGYWNEFTPILNYDSLESYVSGIQQYIADGLLKSASELYYPIRLKPLGANSIENLEKTGVNHIELRMLDLNPLSPVGFFKEDMDFLHMLILYLTSLEDGAFTESEQICASERFSILDGIVTNMSKENKLNLLIFDGEYMYAHTNYADSLHYLESDNGVIFSTLPLSDEGWKNLPINTLFAFKDGRLAFSGTNHRNEFFDNEETLKYLYQIFSDL